MLVRSGSNVQVSVEESLVVDVDATAFDLPGAEYNRTGSSTTYDALMAGLAIDLPGAVLLSKIIHEIEIDAFSRSISQEARVVEHGFRDMQIRFGRDQMTKACYLDFFDNVAAAIDSDTLSSMAGQGLIPDRVCMNDKSGMPEAATLSVRVPTLELENAFQSYAADENIVFVDTRETWEFEEGRIPGAINIKLREVNDSLDQVRDADLVIAYCVKDFRGYEAARAFRKHGINAAIMKPHGMRGWIEAGLPVAGTRGLPEDQALAELHALAKTTISAVQ